MQENPEQRSGEFARQSAEWQRPPVQPPVWKAWVAPGVLFTAIALGGGWLGSYAQKKTDEGAQQNHTVEQDKKIVEGEKEREDLRLRVERCVQKDDYNRDLDRQTGQLNRISDNVDRKAT